MIFNDLVDSFKKHESTILALIENAEDNDFNLRTPEWDGENYQKQKKKRKSCLKNLQNFYARNSSFWANRVYSIQFGKSSHRYAWIFRFLGLYYGSVVFYRPFRGIDHPDNLLHLSKSNKSIVLLNLSLRICTRF
jgi:hypothetical protein